MDYSDLYQGPDKYYPCSPYTDSPGFTLLMRLCYNKIRIVPVEEIKLYLDQHPEEINQQNNHGWSALMIAARNSREWSNPQIVKLLLDHGADPNVPNNEGCTSLIFASEHGNIEAVKLLLEYGANPNPNNCRWLPLISSIRQLDITSNIEIIKLLLAYGADPKYKTSYGTTAFSSICNIYDETRHKQVIKLIKKRKSNQLLIKNQMLKEKNHLLRKELENYAEGNYIMELWKSISKN